MLKEGLSSTSSASSFITTVRHKSKGVATSVLGLTRLGTTIFVLGDQAQLVLVRPWQPICSTYVRYNAPSTWEPYSTQSPPPP